MYLLVVCVSMGKCLMFSAHFCLDYFLLLVCVNVFWKLTYYHDLQIFSLIQ